ncbi:MAG: Bacterial cell division rane protein [Clostridiales bacterium]|jgi:rod shape determining protein RodA|nr:Bacterial cell division rane protein [Clostridiales bacterium]
MFRQYQFDRLDWLLAILVIGISIFGIVAINSATPHDTYAKKQIFGLVIAVIIMIIVALVDYKFIGKCYILLFIVGILMLISLKFIGKNVNGATRWIPIGESFTIQPTEFVKIIMVVFIAKYYDIFKEKVNHPLIIGGIIMITVIPFYLINNQPDLSSSLVIVFLLGICIFVSGINYKFILTAIAILIPLSVIGVWYVQQPNQGLLKDYQLTRILSILHPEEYKMAEYWQQANSIMAIGSGQLDGKGLNNSEVSSVKNANFIIEPQTDFIFAIIGEELGFVGSSIVLFVMFILVTKILLIAKDADDTLGKMMSIGVATILAFQTFINVGVAIAILPNTGIPLPFVSYGLSSLWSSYIGIGIILNISMQRKRVLGKRYSI